MREEAAAAAAAAAMEAEEEREEGETEVVEARKAEEWPRGAEGMAS